VDPVPDPLLLRKSGSAGNTRTRTSASVTRNSDHSTTEAVIIIMMLFLGLIMKISRIVYRRW
jgi:hypothetical protein